MLTVVPAYGRDYSSKAKVAEAVKSGKDFIIADMSSRWDGRYCNAEQLIEDGHTSVRVRYKKRTQVAIVKL